MDVLTACFANTVPADVRQVMNPGLGNIRIDRQKKPGQQGGINLTGSRKLTLEDAGIA